MRATEREAKSQRYRKGGGRLVNISVLWCLTPATMAYRRLLLLLLLSIRATGNAGARGDFFPCVVRKVVAGIVFPLLARVRSARGFGLEPQPGGAVYHLRAMLARAGKTARRTLALRLPQRMQRAGARFFHWIPGEWHLSRDFLRRKEKSVIYYGMEWVLK